MLTIMWIPVLIQFATLLLAAVVAAASRSYLAAMLLVMIGMIAALVFAAYRSYQFWPMALVQADHPQLNAEQVMERCKVMTEGHKFDLFVFDLSYLGWNILSLLTGGILSVLYVAPYKMIATAFVYEEMKGRPVMVDDIKPSTDGNGMTIAVDPKKLMGIGNTGGKKPTSHTVQYNGKDLGFNITDHSRNGVFVNGVRIPYNVPTYVSGKSIVALADGANKFQLIEAADEDDRSPALGADNEE